MGIATILTAALKHVSWGKVANAAFEYGPELIRRLKARQQSGAGLEVVSEEEPDVLYERFREVENALIQQDEMIKRQNQRIIHLEEARKKMQLRLNLSIVIAVVALILAIVILSR